MDLLQLEHFLAVCEEGSFTRAAERVCRTQSAVSQSIKKIEDEIGTPLFARGMHDVTLTEAGKLVLDYAHRMVRLRDEANRQLGALKNLNAGTLTIAAHESAAVYLLPAPLRSYLRSFPHIKVGIYRSRLDDIPRQVLDREVDVGFVKEEPNFRGLEVVDVHSDEMVLIASPQHPLAKRGEVRIHDLSEEGFVLHHLCSSTEQKILRLFDDYSIRCRIVAEVWSFENVKGFVRENVGLAIVPRITAEQELRDGLLVEIPVKELRIPRRTVMIYCSQGHLADSAREMIRIMRDFTLGGSSVRNGDGARELAAVGDRLNRDR
jgi:DNA-binding transcriptional LysR family regulator